ncbi:hypothetical protein FHG87_023996, partial [Trinorchestia longiramus]
PRHTLVLSRSLPPSLPLSLPPLIILPLFPSLPPFFPSLSLIPSPSLSLLHSLSLSLPPSFSFPLFLPLPLHSSRLPVLIRRASFQWTGNLMRRCSAICRGRQSSDTRPGLVSSSLQSNSQ